jgi:hypothetical protein
MVPLAFGLALLLNACVLAPRRHREAERAAARLP